MIPRRIPREELSPGRRDLPRPPSPLPNDPALRQTVLAALAAGVPLNAPASVVSQWIFVHLDKAAAPLSAQIALADRLVAAFHYGASNPQALGAWLVGGGPQEEPDEPEHPLFPKRHPEIVSDNPSPIVFAL